MEVRFPIVALLLAAAPALAAVPPEVPSSRTYQIFAPFFFSPSFGDDGEGVFTSQGPACLDYLKANDFRQFVAPQSGVAAQAGLSQFVIDLQTQSGLQFISSHGNTGVLAIEAFLTQADANAQLIIYQGAGTPSAWRLASGEGQVLNTPDGYFVVAVTAGYIGRILGSNTHSIVFADACESGSLGSAFSGAAVRDYLGFANACTAGQVNQDVGTIFNSMSGIAAINSQNPAYQNFSVAQGVAAANDPILALQSNSGNAGGIRLYDAPRIVFAQVTQDVAGDGSFSNTLYNYPPGQQFAGTYPYGAGTTNYPGSPGTSSFARTGPILINLRFSEPMNPSPANFAVQLQFADGTSQDVTSSGQFRNNAFPNDSWSATVSLPSNPPSGKVTVAVGAQKIVCGANQDVNNQYLDTTGSGSSTPGGQDTSVVFTVGNNLAIKVYQDAVGYASNGDIGSDIGATDPLNGITDGYQIIVDASELSASGSSGVGIGGVSVFQGDPKTGTLIGSISGKFGPDKKFSSADIPALSQLCAVHFRSRRLALEFC